MTSISLMLVSAIRWARLFLPTGRAKEFPNRFGAFLARIGWLRPVWHEFQPGLWMRLNIGDLIQETILLENVWDPLLTDFICATLKPDDVFIDVGANAGYFTLLAAKCVGSSGKVLSIEPNPAIARQLKINVRRSQLANVITEETACFDTSQPLVLYLHDDRNSGKASVSQGSANRGARVQVESTTLDRLVNKYDLQHGLQALTLIKIDVEGAELRVLHGMKETIQGLQPLIVLELEPDLLRGFSSTVDDVMQFLRSFGYRVSSLGGHANYVCAPSAEDRL